MAQRIFETNLCQSMSYHTLISIKDFAMFSNRTYGHEICPLVWGHNAWRAGRGCGPGEHVPKMPILRAHLQEQPSCKRRFQMRVVRLRWVRRPYRCDTRLGLLSTSLFRYRAATSVATASTLVAASSDLRPERFTHEDRSLCLDFRSG